VRTFLDWAPLVIGIFYFVALYFVWQNRASEKIITTAFIGVVGLAGALAVVIVFGAQRPVKTAFSSAFLIRASDQSLYMLPVPLLESRYISGATEAQQLAKDHPDAAQRVGGVSALYNNLLQRQLLD